ncbi:MAG: sll0787 family AIR synthase-like protein [Verrucomicrobia bacterium]|nr:sll0787 family AIR synthase-like protein [Verrucomicrobiota bacterium]
MGTDHATLSRLIKTLKTTRALADKMTVRQAYAPAQAFSGTIRLGDDCAAIPDGDGFLLFAAEGMLESFVADDPWFAGYSAVMVNLSDVAAMGGRPVAVIDVLWTPDLESSAAVWAGMAAASEAYAVPIVGGHTTLTRKTGVFLAAAVLGKAQKLITSFDAQPGDDLLMAVDLRGGYRGAKPFWNASVGAPPKRLREDLRLLPKLAERGWCRAGKDISNGGVVGTLTMLLECSQAGAELWLDQVPRPECVELERWLVSFPSFGHLLSVPPQNVHRVTALFSSRGIACAPIGRVTSPPSLTLGYGSAREEFWAPDARARSPRSATCL